MKRNIVAIVTAIMLFAGCTNHYYSVNKDSVEFYLKRPKSQHVYFLSSLDGFKPHKAMLVDHKTWLVNMPANAEFKYFYNVDGDLYVPPCKLKENDDFGSQNCIFIPGM